MTIHSNRKSHLCIFCERICCHCKVGTAKQAVPTIFCNWLPFHRPCSFASQTFVCFATNVIFIISCHVFSCLFFSALKRKNKRTRRSPHLKRHVGFFYFLFFVISHIFLNLLFHRLPQSRLLPAIVPAHFLLQRQMHRLILLSH